MQAELPRGGCTLAMFVTHDSAQQRRFDEVQELLVKVFLLIALFSQLGFGPLPNELRQGDSRRFRQRLPGGRRSGRQMLWFDHTAANHDHCVFDRIQKFADVAMPRSAREFTFRGCR